MDDVLDNLNDFTVYTDCVNASPQVGTIFHMATGSVSSSTSKRLLQVEIVRGMNYC